LNSYVKGIVRLPKIKDEYLAPAQNIRNRCVIKPYVGEPYLGEAILKVISVKIRALKLCIKKTAKSRFGYKNRPLPVQITLN